MSPENFKRIRGIYSELELDEFLLLLEITKEEFEKAEASGIFDEELTRKLEIAENPAKFFDFILEENSTFDMNNKTHQEALLKVGVIVEIINGMVKASNKVIKKEDKKQKSRIKRLEKKKQKSTN
jgi:hypothetical protein